MTAAGLVERHIVALEWQELAALEVGLHFAQDELHCSVGPALFLVPSKKDSSDQEVEPAQQLSGAATRGSSMRMTRSVCGFGSAPCAISSWPAALYSLR